MTWVHLKEAILDLVSTRGLYQPSDVVLLKVHQLACPLDPSNQLDRGDLMLFLFLFEEIF